MENTTKMAKMEKRKLYQLILFTLFTLVLLAISSSSGLVIKSLYYPYVQGQLASMLMGQDLLSLLSIPILLFAMALTIRKSLLGPIIWSGILLYIIYAYALLAFGAVYTYIFIIYIALMGLSCYSVIIIITSVRYEEYRAAMNAGTNTNIRGSYLIVIGAIISTIWIFSLLRTSIYKVPLMGINTVYILDLTLLLPAFIITGIQQIRRVTWSYYYAGILIVKAITLGLSIILGYIFSIHGGWNINIVLFVIFGISTIVAGIILVVDIKSILNAPSPSAAADALSGGEKNPPVPIPSRRKRRNAK